MSENQPRRRKPASPSTARSARVKATVMLDVSTHAKLAVAAALRGMDRSTYAAELIAEGLRGVVAFDKKLKPADQEEHPDTGDVAA
jgi:hypothetical protein